MRKFQKLIEVQTLPSEPSEAISAQSKLSSFYTELRNTASMYIDFWEELSTRLPNTVVVSQKAQDLYTKVQDVRQQWDHTEFESQSEAAHTYNYFRLNVLYDDKDRTLDGTNGSSWNPDTPKGSQINGKQGNGAVNKSIVSNEDDGTLISTIVKSLYEEKNGRGCSVPLRFNGREDFNEFLGDKKLPSRVTRKRKEVIAASLFPFVFQIILVVLSLGIHFESSFDAFETQYQRNLVMSDLHSEMNDVFESKAGILETSIGDIKSSINYNLNLLESLENKTILPTVQKSRHSNSNNTSLWTPEMTKNTTEVMIEKAKGFVQVQSDKFTTEDPNYKFWANNMQNEYYQGLLNWNELSYKELKEDSEAMPFNTLMGILFFFGTFIVIFLNLLNIYKLVSLGNDAMNIYLSISQPELDALKAKCQSFIDYLDTKRDLEENSHISIEDKPLLVRPAQPAIQQRIRIKPLKQFKRSRTELENRLAFCTMLLIIVSFLLFLIPIPFQREHKVLIDQQMDGFSNITELETSFSFSYNTLKQQLIMQTPVLGHENVTAPLKRSNNKLLQITQNLDNLAFNTSHGGKYQEYNRLVKDFMTGSFCQKLSGEVQERCAGFGVLSKIIESLQQITTEYEKLLENKDQSSQRTGFTQLLTKMEKLNLNSFREDFLKTGLQILRNEYPQMIQKTFEDTLHKVLLYDVIVISLWSALILLLISKVIKPLYQFIEERKKLIRLIPFPLLMNMKDEVIEFIWAYCEVPRHEARNQSTDSELEPQVN